jgi:hypothetical protein
VAAGGEKRSLRGGPKLKLSWKSVLSAKTRRLPSLKDKTLLVLYHRLDDGGLVVCVYRGGRHLLTVDVSADDKVRVFVRDPKMALNGVSCQVRRLSLTPVGG